MSFPVTLVDANQVTRILPMKNSENLRRTEIESDPTWTFASGKLSDDEREKEDGDEFQNGRIEEGSWVRLASHLKYQPATGDRGLWKSVLACHTI
ncbi:hypothetical protein FRB91_007938 [Serendipita sp. 411]|nr:hypothetical protein FRB91_007938 [Serendipita sp. 411]